MKYKYSFTNETISSQNIEIIKKLKFQGRCKEYNNAYVNNSSIIRSSDLVLSINTIPLHLKHYFIKLTH